jgi:hypothetical protein
MTVTAERRMCPQDNCTNAAKYANGDCPKHRARRTRYGSPNGFSLNAETLPVEPLARFVSRCEFPIERTQQLQSALGETRITVATADEIACKVLRIHPSAIWPEWFDMAV